MSLGELQSIGSEISIADPFIHRRAAREAARRAIAWEPERVVIAHGTWVRENGAAALREGFAWLGV